MLSKSLLVCSALVASAFAMGQRQDPHHYDLRDVAWRLSFDWTNRTIHGEVVNTVEVEEAGLNSIWFDCGPLKIERVSVDGQKAAFHLDRERLNVSLPSSGRVGQKLKIAIDYSGSPTAGLYFVDSIHAYPARTGMVFTQGEAEDNRYWLPTYDFPDDKATVEGSIDVPPGQFALSNGKLLGVDKKPAVWTYHWKISEPISTYLISFVAGDYVEGEEFLGKLPVQWYVPRGTEDWGRAAFAGTNKIIACFQKLTGFNYPFEKFSQSAVADFMFGGMENASCVTQTIHALHKPQNEPLSNSEGLVAHELAHQWFGDTVTCMDWSQAWLNEGFATFMPNFWFRQSRGEAEFDAERYGIFQGAIASQEAAKRPVVSNRYEVPMDLFDGQIYGGGAARLFTLMSQIGEKTFWTGVKEYLNEFKFKNATTKDFFAVMSKASKRNLDTFRDQFFYSTEVPEFRVSRAGSNVIIRQDAPGYDLDLKLSFLSRYAVDRDIPVHVHGAETVVHAAGLEGDLAVLDYPVTAMVRIQYEGDFSSADLLRIFRLAPNAAAKLTAISRFEGKVSDEDLLAAAEAEKSGPVLRALLPLLKQNAVPYLVQLSRSFDRETANSAVEALGRFAEDPQTADRLKEVWTRDPNEVIRNTALEGLLSVAKDDSLAKGAWSMDSQWEMYRISAMRWWLQHQPEVARAQCLAVLAGPPDEPLKDEAISELATLKDAKGQHVVFDVLMTIAKEPCFAMRMGAIHALAEYGDPKALPVIEPLTKSSLFFVRRAAEGAIEQIRSKEARR